MHPGQVSVSPATVRVLIGRQFPLWGGLPVREVSSVGTVNAIFRIGDDLVARFPLERDDDVETARARLEREAAAASELLGRTPFATPCPIVIGEPDLHYPMPWSVNSWLPGEPATSDSVNESLSFATDLSDFIAAVRCIDTGGRTFEGTGRGGELLSHDDWVQECLQRSAELLDVTALGAIWEEMRQLPRGESADVMSHCDLIPPNVLVARSRIVGVLDVGGLGPADPALDLVSVWHLLEAPFRAQVRRRLGCDDAEWLRGRAWAFQQAIGAVWYYVDSSPTMSAGCRRTLQRIIDDVGF
jgi:aminoglycoside phosphotransferase (APT) family kinase protein